MMNPSVNLPSVWSGSMSLDAAGLVALADLSTVARRTALTGTSAILDCLVLCPGLHRQQLATNLHNGEIAPMASMSSGYICRVENPATVAFLQKIGRTGQLTIVKVKKQQYFGRSKALDCRHIIASLITCTSMGPTIIFLLIVTATCNAAIFFIICSNWRALGAMVALVVARLCNVVVIRRRTGPHWHGASEPGMLADNLILLSEDCWIRMQGSIDDVKAVTAGQWLRDCTFIEGAATAFATVTVYVTAALTSNVDPYGKIVILALLLISVGLLSVVNEMTEAQQMNGRTISVHQPRIPFERRLSMINKLTAEVGRDDWAIRMGLVLDIDNEREIGHASAKGPARSAQKIDTVVSTATTH